ncbi:MAG: permease [Hydrogenoanaerobacterium sp.]
MNFILAPHEHENPIENGLHAIFTMLLPERWAEFFTHFIGDSINILFILFVVMFAVSLLQTYIPFDKLKNKLNALGGIGGMALALLLGVFSPFCSCTVVPFVMGLLSVGIPSQVALCYLSSAALLNGGTLIALFSTFGVRFGLSYLTVAIIITVLSAVLSRPFAGKENILSYSIGHHHGSHIHTEHCADDACLHHKPTGRIGYAVQNVMHIFKETWVYMLASVALASAILSFVPAEALAGLLGKQNVFSPLLAGIVAAPIHADVFSALPLLRILAPINPSSAMAFALAGMAVSIPEAVLLSRAFKPKAVAAYLGILTVLSVAASYILLVISKFLTIF